MSASTSPKPMKNPAPLDIIAGLSETQIADLSSYWITSIQELLATAELSNGRVYLAEILQVTDDRLEILLQRAAEQIPPERGPDKTREDEAMAAEYSTGVIEPPPQMRADKRYETLSFSGLLPALVDYTDQLPPSRDQGVRGTCVAYAAAAVRELLEIQFLTSAGSSFDVADINLSEQFIYWWCKEQDNLPSVNGTYPHLGMECLETIGAPEEHIWPYNERQLIGDEGQGPPPDKALDEAWRYRIKRVIRLEPNNVESVKTALAKGKPVLFSIPIYNSWYQSRTTRRYGKINMPLPGESANGAHAMALVGYVEDVDAPGGGFFLLRNSWAPWGFDNPQGEGLGSIPFEFIRQHNMEASTGERTSLADVYIRNNAEDVGLLPGTGDRFNSPDIWIRHHDDGEETHQMPRAGEPNTIYVRAWCAGPGTARDIQAKIYQTPASPSIWPNDWQEIGEVSFADIAQEESAVSGLTWTPPDAGPYCFFVRLYSPEDPVQHEWSVRSDNNLAQKNLVILNLKPGESSEFSMRMHGLPDQVSLMDLTVDRSKFPRGRVGLRMAERQRLRGRIKLIEDERKLAELATIATDSEIVGVKITADVQSQPGESGEIIFTQHYGKYLIGRLIVQVNIV